MALNRDLQLTGLFLIGALLDVVSNGYCSGTSPCVSRLDKMDSIVLRQTLTYICYKKNLVMA